MAAIIGDAHAADKGLTTPATHGQQVRGEQRRDGLELAGRCPW
jgi:hypothetical protein